MLFSEFKNITKTEHARLLLFAFLVSFFMAFFAQKLIYTINIWFNFVHGTFFEQDYLLNLIIFGTQMCTYEPDAAQNQADYFF